jgi:peroxiredoxin
MKTYILSFFFLLLCFSIKAQNEGKFTIIEAQKLPDFRFFTASDSALVTNASLQPNKSILFFYFSTKCPYCQEMTGEILNKLDTLKDVQIVMVSGHKRSSILQYINALHLKNTPILVLKDDEKNMHSYFDYTSVPMIRLYNPQRQLIHRQEGRMTVSQIRGIFDKIK